MGKLHYFTLLVIVLLIAIASGGFMDIFSEGPVISEKQPSTTADYYIEKFSIRTLDARGQLSHIVRGDRLVHYPHIESVELEKPEVQVYQQDKIAVSASADKGHYIKSEGRMDLHSNVVVEKKTLNGPSLVLQTSSLSLYPDKQQLVSTEKISLRYGKQIIESTGLNARLKQGTLHFISTVKSRYELAN